MAAPAETSHPPCMSKPAWCLFQNLIHFNPPLLFFINIHSPVAFVIQHSWANAFVVCQTNLTVQYQMPNIWGKLPHVVFQHLLVIWVFTGQWWRPGQCCMTKVFIYSIPLLFPANMLLSLYPFTFSKLFKLSLSFFFPRCLSSMFLSLAFSLRRDHVCLHSVCISVSRTSMSPIPKSNFIVWEKNLIMALRILVLHERKKKTLTIFFIHIFSMFLSL